MRYATKSFYIIYNSWPSEQSTYLWKWWLGARGSTFTFKRIKQCRFFSTHVPSNSCMQMHVKVKSCTHYVFTKISSFLCFGNGFSHDLCCAFISPSQKNIADVCTDSIRCYDHSFQKRVRISFQ